MIHINLLFCFLLFFAGWWVDSLDGLCYCIYSFFDLSFFNILINYNLIKWISGENDLLHENVKNLIG